MSDNVFIDVVEPIDPTLLAPSEKELERWWARQNRAGRGTGGGFDFNSIGTSGSDRGSDSDASDCGGLTLREAQQLVGKRRAEHPGRLDERFGSGMRVKTKLLSATPLSAIPASPIRRTREDSASSAEGTMDPSPRSPLDRAAARDAALDLVGSPKRGRPATTAPTLNPATSSSRAGNDASYASSGTQVQSIDELAPTTSISSDGLQCVDLETGVREIIARETPVGTSDIALGGSSALERMIKRGMDRKIPKPVWTAVGLLWLYAIARLILGA
jgi:hypothetical protein